MHFIVASRWAEGRPLAENGTDAPSSGRRSLRGTPVPRSDRRGRGHEFRLQSGRVSTDEEETQEPVDTVWEQFPGKLQRLRTTLGPQECGTTICPGRWLLI